MQRMIKIFMLWLGFAPTPVAAAAAPTVWVYDNAAELVVVDGLPLQNAVAVALPPKTRTAMKSRRFAARLTSVSRINRKATARKPIGKAFGQRTPDLYPMKRPVLVSKKPTLKVLAIKPKVRPSAMIIPFPAARVRKAKFRIAA